MRIAGTVSESIVDGPGLRLTVFTQGCPHRCPGCHNPQTHDPAGGREETTTALLARYTADPLLDGLTISGGEPMEQAAECAALAEAVHALGGNVWVYTGWRYEALVQESDPARLRLLVCRGGALSGAPLARQPEPAPHRPERDPQNREAHPANGIKKLLQHNRCSSFYVRDSEKL